MLADTLSRLLDGCLDREGQPMTDHQNKEYRVFFRMNRDRNLTIDHLSIYHRADSGIVPGLELRFVGGDQNTVLLVLNSEHVEGSVYRRSDCVKCNHYVDLCYVTTGMDEKGDTTTVAQAYDQNVPVYVSSGINTNGLTMNADDLRFIMSARHCVAISSSIKITELEETKTHQFSPSVAYYEPIAVDFSNMIVNTGNSISGLLGVLTRSDTRPHNT